MRTDLYVVCSSRPGKVVFASWQVVIMTHSEIMGWLWSTLLFIHVILYKDLSYPNVIISAECIRVIETELSKYFFVCFLFSGLIVDKNLWNSIDISKQDTRGGGCV